MRTLAPTGWPADVAELAAGEVRVYAVALDEPGPEPLVATERERADRFAQPDDRRRWTRARGALRSILAAHAHAEPESIRIEPAACVKCGEPHGKPYLAEPETDGPLRFNISHSGELALVAVARGREVGVDVEALHDRRSVEGIAERWFTDAEVAELSELGEAERLAAFYRLWARKEAYLKATAEGIMAERGSFDARDPTFPGWEFADLDAGPGYAAALAVAPPGFTPGV
jgi:4'-phosphopantetheinyl transferase